MGYTRVPRIVYAHIRVPDQPHKRPNKSPLRTRQTIGDAVECIQHDSHAAAPQRCSIGEHMGYTRVPRIVYAHIRVPDQPHKRPNKSPLRTRKTIGDAVECIQHDSHAAAPQRCSIGEHMGYTRVPRNVYAHIQVPEQPHKRPNKSPLRTRQTIGDAVECIQHDSHAATPQRCSIGEHMGYTTVPRIVYYAHIQTP